MIKNISVLIVVFFLILFLIICNISKKEHFVDGNFKLCKKNDCECLKMSTAPDGTCVRYRISRMPLIPEYENKKFYEKNVVQNNLYPKKK